MLFGERHANRPSWHIKHPGAVYKHRQRLLPYHSYHPHHLNLMQTFLSVTTSSGSRRTTSWRVVGASLALWALTACAGDLGEAKLKAIPKGAKRDVVLAALGTGPLTAMRENDALRVVSGFRRQVFITQARQIEVVWYREEPGTLNDVITQKTETPVVIEADSLVGWGWKFYSPFAIEMKLPDPMREAFRLDSMAKASAAPPKSN